MNYKFAQFIQTPGKKAKSFSDVFVAQPDSHKEELAGKLFVVLEINSKDTKGLKIINFLLDSIVQNFYQNEKLILRERLSTLKIEHIFEASLAKTNKHFTDFLKNERIKINASDLNITTGVVFENEIHIANIGTNKALLIIPNTKPEENQERFKLVDIFKSSGHEEEKIDRIFSNVISGHIPEKAALLICNETLPEYISKNKLSEIISSLPPIGATEQIKNITKNINAYVSFLGVIIKSTATPKTQVEARERVKINSNESINKLNTTESETEQLLTPSGMINFKKWLGVLSLPFSSFSNNKAKKSALGLKDKILVKRISTSKKISGLLSNFFSNLFIAFSRIIRNINQAKIFKTIFSLAGLKIFFGKVQNFFARGKLNKRKILLALSIILIVVFIFNITRTKEKNEKIVEEQSYSELTEMIEKKQNQAEASLLYSNDEGAKKLFDEINSLIEELPTETEEQQSQYNEFKEKFNVQLEKIRRITRLDDATLIDNLNNLNSRANPQNITLIASKGNLYISDATNKSFYITDIFEKQSTTIAELDKEIIRLDYPLLIQEEEKNEIIYFNAENLISLSAEEKTTEIYSINLASSDVVDMDIYNSNIYLLNPSAGQIYRHQRTGNNFGSPTPWINDGSNIENAINLAIDGNIYILFSDASIKRYLRGSEVDFDLELCDPPLESPTKIKLSQEEDFLYILEPKNRRMLVYSKDGQFQMQYMSETFDDLKDFVVNEENKKLYFLNGTLVYQTEASHF
ncbi:hypothetical protein C0583_02865 [Candidatus Parcubacteria bacterium]|nr:MAG: hypothetical protein C0583_02865 [Candidatus Parcubacteria bacterium]